MISGIRLQPDSILLNGPSELISQIDSIGTKKVTKKNIEESFEEEVGIQVPNSSKVLLNSTFAIIQVEVEEFTQKQVTVPIQLVNVPSDVKLRLIPENITVKFEVAVKDFNTIEASHFQVVCDFDEKITEGHFMIPKIVQKPEEVFRVDLTTKKVEYLIFKQ